MPIVDKIELNHAVRRRSRRKVEAICKKTYEAFYAECQMWGTMDAEEIMACGINLIESILIKPLQRMSADPVKMRESVVYQIAALVGGQEEEVRQ